MRNRTYGGVRGRKTKVGRKLLRFPPTRLCELLASRYRTPLSLRDISRGRMETADAVSVARRLSVHRRRVALVADSRLVPSKTFSRNKTSLRMLFVPLKTFIRNQIVREVLFVAVEEAVVFRK